MILLVALGLAIFVLDRPWSFVVVAVGAALELGETWFWWWYSRRGAPKVGVETLVGRRGTVTVALRPEGQVRVAGELWQARSEDDVERGSEVEVVAVDGLTLVVRPA